MSRTPFAIRILSCVGGGPMERLARAVREELGGEAHVVAGYEPEAWRARMAAGRTGRLRARLGSMVVYPLHALVSAAFSPKGSYIIPTTNPFFLPGLLVATRAVHRKAVVPLVYDLYPDALEAGGVASSSGALASVARRFNRYWLRKADAVVFIGAKMAEHVCAETATPSRWTVIETGASLREFDDVSLAPPYTPLEDWIGNRSVISYVGNLGHLHDWETFARGFDELATEIRQNDFVLVVAASGPGAEKLRERLEPLDRDHIRLVEPLDDRDWGRLLKRTSLALVSLRASANRTSIPSKLFSSLAAGCGILAVAPRDSDIGQIVSDTGCGALVEPGDVPGLVRELRRFLVDETLRARYRAQAQRAAEHYDLNMLALRWQSFLTGCDQRETTDDEEAAV